MADKRSTEMSALGRLPTLLALGMLMSGLAVGCKEADDARNSLDTSNVQGNGSLQSKPGQSTVTEIESKIKLPSGSRPLSSYVRYYSSDENGTVIATYFFDSTPGRVVIVGKGDMPGIMDGGCDVINVRYSVSNRQFEQVFCNGVA
jgi:hypothetical protein